jgi:hypothetical protein
MTDRTPTDGKPYYCVRCKLGFAEYMACEGVACKLESEASAEMRQLFVKKAKRREKWRQSGR